MLMATPPGTSLLTLMLPPALLLRIGTPPPGVSFDETLIGELMLTAPFVVLRFTLPPVPLGGGSAVRKPVVAVMGLSTVIAPVALTVNVPPSPTGMVLFGLLPPLNVTEPWMLSPGLEPKVSDGTLMVSCPPANGPKPGGLSKSGPLKLIPPVEVRALVVIV